MAAAIGLRTDFDGAELRRLARCSGDANQTRRLLSLAVVYDGGRRSEAAVVGGVTLQIVRDWVLRFNEHGPDGLIDRKAPGATPKLGPAQRLALAERVERGPIPAVDGVVRWRVKDLVRWIYEEFSISIDDTTVGRELRAMGFAKLSARPRHHAQNEFAAEAFKKVSPRRLRRSATGSRPARP